MYGAYRPRPLPRPHLSRRVLGILLRLWHTHAFGIFSCLGLALTLAFTTFTTFATAFALVVFALRLSLTTRRSVSIVLAATSLGPSSSSLSFSFPFALDVADAICEYSLWCIVLAKFLADNLEEDMRDHETTVGMAQPDHIVVGIGTL